MPEVQVLARGLAEVCGRLGSLEEVVCRDHGYEVKTDRAVTLEGLRPTATMLGAGPRGPGVQERLCGIRARLRDEHETLAGTLSRIGFHDDSPRPPSDVNTTVRPESNDLEEVLSDLELLLTAHAGLLGRLGARL